jgi:hypothetical protein
VAAYSVYSQLLPYLDAVSSIHNLRIHYAVVAGDPPNMDWQKLTKENCFVLNLDQSMCDIQDVQVSNQTISYVAVSRCKMPYEVKGLPY